MNRNTKHRMKIYKSRAHLAATFLIILAPFLFLLLFSKIERIATSKLFSDVFVSIGRLVTAYIISVVFAWVLAVSFFDGRRANVALPIFDVLQSFPVFSGVPLAVTFWGATNFTVIFFLVITMVWSILFPIISSLKLIRHDWNEAVEIFDLRGMNYLKKFLWPISLPGLITGSIIGLGNGWATLVATEIIINIRSGLGSFFQNYAMNTQITIFGILGLLVIVFSINKLIWGPLVENTHRMMEE